MSPPTEPEAIFGSARLTTDEVRDGMVAASPVLRYRWIGALALAIYAAIEARSLCRPGAGGTAAAFAYLIPTAVICGALVLMPYFWGRKWLEALGGDRGEIRYRLDADGLTSQAPGASGTISWRLIERHRETRLTFLVYASGVARIIPKRAFGPTDVERVRALLAARVGVDKKTMERTP